MRSVLFRFRAELRARGWAWAAVAVLAGLFYGSVMAAAVGGQRTNTVVERSIRNKVNPDVFMVPAFSENGDLLDFDAIAAFPEVSQSLRAPLFPTLEDYDVLGFPDIDDVARGSRLLSGRLPDPDAPDEALANFVAEEERHLSVGDVVDLNLVGPGFEGEGEPPPGLSQKVKIVGIVAALGDFASVAGPGITVTPAFIDAYGDRATTFDLYMFVLDRHDDDLPAFRRHMSELTGGEPVLFVEGRNDWVQIQRSFHVQAVALWILAAFLGVVSLLIFSQTLARLALVESADDPTLSALGMPRSQRLTLAAARGVVVAVVGASIGTGLAVLVSGLMPFGRPRLAETSPGLSAPALSMATGFAIVFVVLMLQCTIPVLRGRRTRVRPSRASAIAAKVPGATASVGLGYALDPGRGTDAVPVRSGLAGLTFGVLALVLSLTVSASLTHLLDTPHSYGWNWDAAVELGDDPDAGARIESTPGVAAVTYGTSSAQVSVGGESAELVAMEPGPVTPVMLEGGPPTGEDEVALARKTLRAADASVGSTVDVALQGQQESHSMRVTRVVVLPVESDISTLGEGVLVSMAGLRTFVPEIEPDVAFIRFDEGADPASVGAEIAPPDSGSQGLVVPERPSTLVDFGRVRSLPLILAGLLALLGFATMAHVLVSSVRRRRRDLSVLKSVGFDGRDIRAVVMWQGMALAVLSLIVGIPLGVIAGRWLWDAFAHDAGFVGEPQTELVPLVVVAGGVIVATILMALVVGRSAARTRPATVLRSE